jgi:threonine dehydrogenase-like Zn-dependent dehydrogenase
MGAAEIYGVDADAGRLRISEKFGATRTILAGDDPVRQIRSHTNGRGVDVAIEALGQQATFENALQVVRPGGVLSSVGVYSGHLRIPLDAFGAGLADKTIVTTLCPGGKERMLRLMRLVIARRIDLTPLFTHVFSLDEIERAYGVFESRKEFVLKVAIRVR